MNKKIMMYSLILVWAAVLLQLVVVMGMKDDRKIVEAFQAGNALPVQCTVKVTAAFPRYLVSEEEKKDLLQYLAKGLSISKYEYQSGTKQMLKSHNAWSETRLTLMEKDKSQQYVAAQILMTDHMESVIAYKEKLERLYRKLNMEASSFIAIQGNYEGSVDNEQLEQMKNQVFKVLECKEVGTQMVSDAKIYYGFTQRLKEFRKQKGRKINVQLVFSYDQTVNKTKMYLAVPFYNDEF